MCRDRGTANPDLYRDRGRCENAVRECNDVWGCVTRRQDVRPVGGHIQHRISFVIKSYIFFNKRGGSCNFFYEFGFQRRGKSTLKCVISTTFSTIYITKRGNMWLGPPPLPLDQPPKNISSLILSLVLLEYRVNLIHMWITYHNNFHSCYRSKWHTCIAI